MIIQIIGLPGSGKTTLAETLKERTNAIHLNADEIRSTVNSDLGFTAEDRINCRSYLISIKMNSINSFFKCRC